MGPGIPNVAVLLNGSVRWVPLPTVAAGTELRRHRALILDRGRGTKGPFRGHPSALTTTSDSQGSGAVPYVAPPRLTNTTVPRGTDTVP